MWWPIRTAWATSGRYYLGEVNLGRADVVG